MKKLVALLLAVLMLSVSFAALAEVPEGYPEIVPEMIQAEKKTITIYDYWSGDGARAAEPTEEQQAQYDYRDWIEATYNVKVQQIQGGDWGTCAEEMINFTSAPDGSLRAYIIEPGKVGSLVANGVAASWGDYDFSAEKWNTFTLNAWKIGDDIYGVSTGATEPRGCVYFNKRILEEAGIDWNTIYDMQAEGTWTWAAWEELLKKTTKDTDNDGVLDIYGMTGSNSDLYMMGVVSNGGEFFRFSPRALAVSFPCCFDRMVSSTSWSLYSVRRSTRPCIFRYITVLRSAARLVRQIVSRSPGGHKQLPVVIRIHDASLPRVGCAEWGELCSHSE